MQNEFFFPSVAIISKTPDESREMLREYAQSKEWWLIVCDKLGWVLVQPMIRRHYHNASDDDYAAVICELENGMMFTVVLLRRLRMSVDKYKFELSKQGVAVTERELLAGGALLRCSKENERAARKFARTMLEAVTMGEHLGMEE